MKRAGFIAGSAAAGVSAMAAPAGATYGDTPIAGTVTIGVVAPFTGDSIRYGEQLGNGVRAALDDANQLRGPLDKVFVVRTFDDQNLLATGLVNAQFACDDPEVSAVIGHLSGRITEAAMQTYVSNQMPVINPASSYDRLTAHGYGNLLRLQTKDTTEGHLAARHINATKKPLGVAALYQEADYGPDVLVGFVTQMQSDKVPITPATLDLEKPEFDAAAKGIVGSEGGHRVSRGPRQRHGRHPTGAAERGLHRRHLRLPGLLRCRHDHEVRRGSGRLDDLEFDAAARDRARVRSASKATSSASTDRSHHSSAFGYAAAQIVVSVVQRTNANDRVAVARALNISSAFNTLVGSLTFQNDGDPLDANVYFYTVKNGAWRYVASAIPSSYIGK